MNACNENRIALAEYIKNFLIKQGKPSQDEKGDCIYLNKDGSKCAVGCLIPANMYSSSFEGKTVATLPANLLTYLSNIYNIPLNIITQDLTDFQDFHDTNSICLDFISRIENDFNSFIKSLS